MTKTFKISDESQSLEFTAEVHKLVPDNLRGLLRDLHSLSSRHAILLGWASNFPNLVQMNALLEHHRPKSDDPDFRALWSVNRSKGDIFERSVNCKEIAGDWQKIGMSSNEPNLELQYD